MKAEPDHYPVMASEVRDFFLNHDLELLVDCTLGMGGHVRAVLKDRGKRNIRVIACDCDPESLQKARQNLAEFSEFIEYHRLNYTRLFKRARLFSRKRGLLLVDQGLSRYQIKDQRRGFSHSIDSGLDMRRDPDGTLTAGEVINRYSFNQLRDVFMRYGEIKNTDRLVQRIVERRLNGGISTTGQLTAIVEEVSRWRPTPGKLHPAARVYQALRILVNNELGDLEEFLDRVTGLQPGMAVVILTYHSLEDRLVKRKFQDYEGRGKLRIIPPFPRFPRPDEIAQNPPSRSVRFRAGVRI